MDHQLLHLYTIATKQLALCASSFDSGNIAKGVKALKVVVALCEDNPAYALHRFEPLDGTLHAVVSDCVRATASADINRRTLRDLQTRLDVLQRTRIH